MEKPDWEITATTVYCDAVSDEVTLLVYADGACKCTGSRKYTAGGKKTRSKNKPSGTCSEVDCVTLRQYRDRLLKGYFARSD
jgi:hypothetical protein